jgi:predicted kinase
VRLNQLGSAGAITDTIAAVNDYELAEAVWQEAIERWPDATIILRQGARVVHSSQFDSSSSRCYALALGSDRAALAFGVACHVSAFPGFPLI